MQKFLARGVGFGVGEAVHIVPSQQPGPGFHVGGEVRGEPQGAFRLGPTSGLAKVEGVQAMSWAVDLMEQRLNPARHIKGDGRDAVVDEGE
ncbi:hypothetical protein [Streptomyces sp. NPDC003554]